MRSDNALHRINTDGDREMPDLKIIQVIAGRADSIGFWVVAPGEYGTHSDVAGPFKTEAEAEQALEEAKTEFWESH